MARLATKRSKRVRLVCMGGIAASACGGEAGFSGPPEGGGNDLRPGLTVHVGIPPAAGSIASTLGWSGGVPGAEVRIHRFETDFSWTTVVTDENGFANFPTSISGRYRVAAFRPFTASERQVTGSDILALGAGDFREVGVQTQVDLVPGVTSPHGLVISEIYATAPSPAEVQYDFHMFFEVYNNSDRVLFLDGVLFGTMQGIPQWSGTAPCAESEPFRSDPGGVWAHFLHEFPGSGSEHPIGPGEVRLVALDAIDHSTIDARFPDLSGADFELFGPGDVDNPDAANVGEVGLEPYFSGHGLRYFISHTLFLAAPRDVTSFETGILQAFGEEFVRVPAAAILDVISTLEDDALEDQRMEWCDEFVHPSFDQLGGGFIKHQTDLGLSVQRLVVDASGQRILQDTNTSAVDLIKAPYTPGWIP
ncbi:MAG: DUF4876 domain-containing protein [Gemmatimonadetes bacterium]|nr:DUF4876 domain-containing protein [Gemmatimonadota bacterium]